MTGDELRDVLASAICRARYECNHPMLRGWVVSPADENGADAVLAVLREHRDDVLTLVGMVRLPGDWCMTHGNILFNPGSVEPSCAMAPVYAATSQEDQ